MRLLSSAVLLFALTLAGPAQAGNNNQAAKLVQDIRQDLAPIENQIRNHPYITALENGQVPVSNLRAFAGEQYHIIKSDLRSARTRPRSGAPRGCCRPTSWISGTPWRRIDAVRVGERPYGAGKRRTRGAALVWPGGRAIRAGERP